MIQVAIDVHGMGQDRKVCLADEIFAQRPNILASILVLPCVGVGHGGVGGAWNVLLMTFQVVVPRIPCWALH